MFPFYSKNSLTVLALSTGLGYLGYSGVNSMVDWSKLDWNRLSGIIEQLMSLLQNVR